MDNQFRFYNTLTRKIETVIPHEDGKIKMYTDRKSTRLNSSHQI